MNLDDYMTATEANAVLKYAGRNGVSQKAKAGKIPGAVLVSPRLWLVPKKWVAEEALKMERGENTGPGKPRGRRKASP